ncbi:MAG TPA: hypothetical protein VI011_00070 [Asanoa sp.]
MSKDYVDPSGNTEQFQAFMARQETTPAPTPAATRMPLVIGAVVAAVIVIAVVAFLAL